MGRKKQYVEPLDGRYRVIIEGVSPEVDGGRFLTEKTPYANIAPIG